MSDNYEDKLMADAGKLPQEISPQRDLWPGIEAAIEEPPERTVRMSYFAQAAAVVLLVAGSSSITYFLTKQEATVPMPVVQTGFDSEFASFGSNYVMSQEFRDARDYLIADLAAELQRLSPEARQEVEDNLKVIRQAIVDINAALAAEPENVLLQDMLRKSYREELALMRNVGGLTQSVVSRDDI